MKRSKLNMVINGLLFVAFIPCALTGIMKLPIFLNYLDLFEHISYELVSIIHDYSGLILIFLIIVHILLHKKYVSGMIMKMKNRKPDTTL